MGGGAVQIRVRFYALIRDRIGVKEAQVEVPAQATVDEALRMVAARFPPFAEFLNGRRDLLLVARNREYATGDATLADGDELALFPPVSGGLGSKGLLLLSGGFDSPVAGRFALDQGHALDAVHFSFEPFTDDAPTRKAAELARILGLSRLTVVPVGQQLAEVTRTCPPKYYFVLQKRLMVRLAGTLADEASSSFLVTGENLGQVSSQTLINLGTIDAAARLPILRPLLGWDKQDIISHARRIGTYEASCGPEVCDVLGPRHPSTHVSLDTILREEAKLDLERLQREALAGAFVVDPRKGYEPPSGRSGEARAPQPCAPY